jgi:2-octaprenyl-6-methoxyphenol hydroxylase
MPAAAAQRRLQLDDAGFAAELQQAFGSRSGRIVRVGPRASYPLHEQSRGTLREHRVVWIGNAAQTLHPVAGQGLNLGMRDAAQLADGIAAAQAAGRDLSAVLEDYEHSRRADRAAILGLTRRLPGLFATRAMPVAAVRSLGLTALNVFPDLRRQFARLLMFGVRS